MLFYNGYNNIIYVNFDKFKFKSFQCTVYHFDQIVTTTFLTDVSHLNWKFTILGLIHLFKNKTNLISIIYILS